MSAQIGIGAAARPTVAPDVEERLARFVESSAFSTQGGVVTDLDGTVVFESQGTTLLAPEVERALEALYALGRPLMINSLRFPLSVLRSFAVDWYRLSNAPIPTVSLNGAQLGLIHVTGSGEPSFEEIDAFPLQPAEIDALVGRVENLLAAGFDNLLLFHYPRDWREGEILWTPTEARIPALIERYTSASLVETGDAASLRARLSAREICMAFLLVDAPEDRLMAYQHTRRSNFFTRAGIDKLAGARALAERLGVELRHSVGAGDTEMDRFLEGVGLALHVGPQKLGYRGLVDTIRVRDAGELAALLFRLVALERERVARGEAPPPPAGE